MKAKSIILFIAALALSFLAATHRWGDSAHAIGVIRSAGGGVRHPAFLSGEGRTSSLIVTARVLPPYRGDARIVLEGEPRLEHKVHLSGPVADLGIRRHPELRDNIIRDLQPKDRIALWVEIKQPAAPACEVAERPSGGADTSCCDEPAPVSGSAASREGKYALALYDTKTNRSVLSVPVIFRGKGGHADEGGYRH